MAHRYGCGSAGGAMSFWLRLIDCTGNNGIITTRTLIRTTREFRFTTGFFVRCSGGTEHLGTNETIISFLTRQSVKV